MHRIAFALLVALVVSGCTFAAVKPDVVVAPPPDAPKVLVIGQVSVKDALWEPYKLHFTRGVEKWLKEKNAFESVLPERPRTLPERSIVLVGTITDVDKGSTALRWVVGMGAGQAKVKGDFEIQSPSGAVLAKFSTRESYLGGWGIGGPGFLDMEDLVKRFAETVAATTVQWARGEKLDQ